MRGASDEEEAGPVGRSEGTVDKTCRGLDRLGFHCIPCCKSARLNRDRWSGLGRVTLEGPAQAQQRDRCRQRTIWRDRQLARAARRADQRRQRVQPLSVQRKLERLAGNPVVHVRRHGAARRALYAEDERACPRRPRLRHGVASARASGSTSSAAFCSCCRSASSSIYFTWPWFVDSWTINEASSNAGGLIRWPVKLLLPVGFVLMALQGISEIIKRIAALEHVIDIEFKYEKPLQ